jgi:hypothetical protein
VGFEVLTAVTMKISALKMEEACSSEMAVTIYKTTRRHSPEDSNLQVCQTLSIHLAQDVAAVTSSSGQGNGRLGISFARRTLLRGDSELTPSANDGIVTSKEETLSSCSGRAHAVSWSTCRLSSLRPLQFSFV